MPLIEAAYRRILPWFLPGLAVFVLLGTLLARPVARVFRASSWLGFFLVVSFGIIFSATLTPLHGDFNFAAVGGTCDLSRIGLAPLREVLRIGDTSLNIAMFMPFGLAIGLLARSRPKALLVAVAAVLPFVIETTQLFLPALERGCQSADVVDNLTGLAIGLLIGSGIGRWLALAVEPPAPTAGRP
ncbi:MAG: VanZ family protein [Candidatus Limnocylindrales bacterium]